MTFPGWIFTLLILIPNVALLFLPPNQVPPERRKTTLARVLEGVERAGQIATFTLPFFYTAHLGAPAQWAALGVAAAALALYYAGWARFHRRGRAFAWMFLPLAGIPLPLALAPMLYFGAAAALLSSWGMAAATVFLAIGHGYTSYQELLRVRAAQAE